MPFSRRDILKLSGTLLASSAFATTTQSKKTFTPKKPSKNPKVIVVGGGWSGLSLAKQVKLDAPDAEVILVEKRSQFVSCPMSNLWLVDRVSTDYLTHDYLKAAREHNYEFFNATAIGLDKEQQLLHTTQGDLYYDHIVFAPGIEYDYSFLTDDVEVEKRLRRDYPAGFIAGNEHLTLKEKIKNFKGGNFIFSVPAGNYRCLPAPYERATLVADYFKQKGIKAKVIILDENNDITIKEHGFHTAMEELYKDYIEYHPNAKIEDIDLEKKVIETEFDEFSFDDASFYPHVRGAKILEVCGIAKDTIYNKMEGDIDPITYEVRGYSNIYVSGDARPMGFSKSGNTSNTEALYVAKLIANKINKKPAIKWISPVTICFSSISIAPERAIFVHSEYAFNKKRGQFEFATPVTSEVWKGKEGLDNAKGLYDWADSLYIDMFGA